MRVVVDLSEVEFIDSTALGVLIEARTRVHNRRAFLLAAPGLETKRALEISGLDRHFTVHDSVSEALLAKVYRPSTYAIGTAAGASVFSPRLIKNPAATIAASPKKASAQNAKPYPWVSASGTERPDFTSDLKCVAKTVEA